MPIEASDINFYLSGGVSNTDPNASLGGVRSTTALVDATLNNLFARVSGAEALAGSVKYRCFYVRNEHASLDWEEVASYIQQQTPSADTDVAIGLDPAGIDGAATTVADEDAAPAGVTFSTPGAGSPLSFGGDLEPDSFQAIWVRRTVQAEASAQNLDNAIIRVQGDSAEAE